MKHRLPLCLAALALMGLILWQALTMKPSVPGMPGAEPAARRLIRIWVADTIGGGEKWLRACLRTYEKQHPGTMTFLRFVSMEEISRPDAVLPDLLLYTPGMVERPQDHFLPIANVTGIREEVLRAGRWQGEQYALPLCYAGYALAIDAALEPHLAVTPAPTTLLGRPSATLQPDAAATPGLPGEAAVLAPKGCGLFTLEQVSDGLPALAEGSGTMLSAEVYAAFRARKAPAALLTTGQIAALDGVFPFRVITPEEVVTDQMFLASLFPGADQAAASLVRFLTETEMQRALAGQSLHTVRDDLRLYAAGTEGLMESAARRSLSAVNAFVPAQDVETAAWQALHHQITLDDALLPIL